MRRLLQLQGHFGVCIIFQFESKFCVGFLVSLVHLLAGSFVFFVLLTETFLAFWDRLEILRNFNHFVFDFRNILVLQVLIKSIFDLGNCSA